MKKLSNYFLILIAIFVFSKSVYGTIVYTDITDSPLNNGGTFDINIDNIGAVEYSFDNTMGNPYIMFTTNNHLVTVSTNEWDVIQGLALNTPINSNTGFYDQGDGGINPGWQQTYTFPSGIDQYLGCKFNVGANTYYGWIRVQLNGTVLTFKDYAYNNTPNTAINAGDYGSTNNIISNEKEIFSIYPNPAQSKIHIQNITSKDIQSISIVDLNGNQLFYTDYYLNEINIENLKQGNYFLLINHLDCQNNFQFIKE
ncbi:MAG: T9SS type A sorting domain-containing protein [Flavobacteriia bacterium]|nr:T9SS type A sorting domain-containing protein [Flavobacteriia bacterium]